VLYFLLIIIAIGVLLASKAGQELLALIIGLLFIGVVLYVGFWIVVFVIGLFSDKNIRDTIFTFIGGALLICCITYLITKGYEFIKKYPTIRKIVDKMEDIDNISLNKEGIKKILLIIFLIAITFFLFLGGGFIWCWISSWISKGYF
jgi:hypothetical protein